MGKVDKVEFGTDGKIRRIDIKYFNGTDSVPQFSNRAVRSVAKLFSIDEISLSEDLAVLKQRLEKTGYGEPKQVPSTKSAANFLQKFPVACSLEVSANLVSGTTLCVSENASPIDDFISIDTSYSDILSEVIMSENLQLEE